MCSDVLSESEGDDGHYDQVSPTGNSLHLEQNYVDSLDYLFQMCLKIENVHNEKLMVCNFEANLLILPTILLAPNKPSYVVFPMNQNDFSKYPNPKFILSAIIDDHTIANAQVDVSAEFETLRDEYENFPDSFVVKKCEDVLFRSEDGEIGSASFTLELFCLGPSIDTELLGQQSQPTPQLFKFTFFVEKITGKQLKRCDLQASSFFLPAVIPLKPLEHKAIFFTMNKSDFFEIDSPKICISAIVRGKVFSAENIDFTTELLRLHNSLELYKLPICVKKKTIVNLPAIEKDKIVGRVYFRLEMKYFGSSCVEELKEEVAANLAEASIADDDGKYDEYSANVSEHSLVIKLLRGKAEDECFCDKPGLLKGNKLASDENKKKDGKLVFQVPTKGKRANADENCSAAVIADIFGVKIGKKDISDDSKGRLEMELVAPKNIVDHFKKPMATKCVQTDPEPKTKKGKKK